MLRRIAAMLLAVTLSLILPLCATAASTKKATSTAEPAAVEIADSEEHDKSKFTPFEYILIVATLIEFFVIFVERAWRKSGKKEHEKELLRQIDNAKREREDYERRLAESEDKLRKSNAAYLQQLDDMTSFTREMHFLSRNFNDERIYCNICDYMSLDEVRRFVNRIKDIYSEMHRRLSKYDELYEKHITDPFAKNIWSKYVLTDQLVEYFANSPERAADIFDSISLVEVESFVCKIRGSNGSVYSTSLYSCTCDHFAKGHKPCKHMFYVAIQLGVACMSDEQSKKLSDALALYIDRTSELIFQEENAKREIKELQKELSEKRHSIDMLSAEITKVKNKQKTYNKLIAQKNITFPWISSIYADYIKTKELASAEELRTKTPPALKAAEILSRSAKEKKAIALQLKAAEHTIAVYESVAPWLSEFTEIPPKELRIEESSSNPTEYEELHRWLSRSEYEKLTTAEKYQLALERYENRHKSNWEIGIDYERYIGYIYESKGYRVTYHGATMGFGDLGRDLIVKNSTETLIIQCKRWSDKKVIHENHICQLYGSVIAYTIDNPQENIKGVLICTCPLSETAEKFAHYLSVQVENVPYNTYPLIKCNINKSSKEKIYHMPFDQQYDRISIDIQNGECYAFTVEEAEALGFRCAFRHIQK